MKIYKSIKINYLYLFALILLIAYVLLAVLAATGIMASGHATSTTEVFQSPSWSHWLGTDIFGRDIFSRATHGTIIALSIGTLSALMAVMIGTLLGTLAGYFGGWVDSGIVWLYSTWDSIPYILLLAAFAWSLGSGLTNVFLALGFTSWVTTCRLVRMEVIKQKQRDYVAAGKALGFNNTRIIIHHILPHLLPMIIVQFGLCFVFAIKTEVILSFLGLGAEPGTASWGLMIDDGKQEVAKGFWWNVLAGSGFMFGLILAVNLLIEGVREHLSEPTGTR